MELVVTPLGYIFALYLASAALFRLPALWVAAPSFAFFDSAVMTVMDIGVAPQYLASAFLLVRHLWTRALDSQGTAMGLASWQRTAIGLLLVASISAYLGPFLFAGIYVFSPDIGLDEQVITLSKLSFSVSNIGQAGYLFANVTLAFLIAVDGRRGDAGLTVFLVLGLGVALASTVVGDAYPHALFDNVPDGFYAVGDVRLRGQFAEPSHLAAFAVAAGTYLCSELFGSHSLGRKAFVAVGVLISIACLYFARSGTGLVAVAILLAGFVAYGLFRAVRQARVSIWATGGALAACGFIVLAAPALWAFYQEAAVEKLGTISQVTRWRADLHGLELLWQSYLMGVGIGSNRTSSLLPLLLSTVGIVGTYLFCRLILLSLRSASDTHRQHSMAWGLTAICAASLVSFAVLTVPAIWLFMGACLQAPMKKESRPAARGSIAKPEHQTTNEGRGHD